VILELEMLFELGRVPDSAARVVGDLGNRFGLAISQVPFADVVEAACTFAWTRDPFDRLIVANAMADGVRLLTADETILRNYSDAVW
jgi:PIN domain nuclease of toxin-antitoxin system